MNILYNIARGVDQFSKLKARFRALSDQVLGQRLRELKQEALIEARKDEQTTPVNIIYTVTSRGNPLLKIIGKLHDWGGKHK